MNELGLSLLHIGTLLMRSGANTERIKITIDRICSTFGYTADTFVSYSSLVLTLSDSSGDDHFFRSKQTPSHHINFKIVSGISRMSWQVVEEKWSVDQINAEVDRLTSLPHYQRWTTRAVVGLAGASFCRLAGGGFWDMLVVWVATVAGVWVLQNAVKKQFNFYLCVFFAACTASFIAGVVLRYGQGFFHPAAFATSVLFLIPGVPLINSFSDLIDGHIQNAMARGMHGLVISFSIALGLLTAMFLSQL